MSDDGIWLVGGDGGLVPMEPSKPASEDDLQSLIARHCEVIAGDGEKLLLVRREQGIADSEEAVDSQVKGDIDVRGFFGLSEEVRNIINTGGFWSFESGPI